MTFPRGRRPDGIVQPLACASSEVSSRRFPRTRSSSAQMRLLSGGRTEPGKSFSSRPLNWLPTAHTRCLACCAARPEPNGRWPRCCPPGRRSFCSINTLWRSRAASTRWSAPCSCASWPPDVTTPTRPRLRFR